MSNSELIGAAKAFLARGWSVLPVNSAKKPAITDWKPLQTIPMAAGEIDTAFSGPDVRGVGVVCGPVSGDLWVRDFDDAGAYQDWADEHPELAAKLPTVRTHRGYHLYGCWPGVRTRKCEDGELRSQGAYVVAPPSVHPEGTHYEWMVPLSHSPLPHLDPAAIGLITARSIKGQGETVTQGRQSVVPVDPKTLRPHDPVRPCDPVSLPIDWKQQAQQYVVKGRGEHDQQTMALARLVSLGWGVKDRVKRREVFDYWWVESRPQCSEQCDDEAWFKFQRACETARIPVGAKAFHREAMTLVDSGPLPTFTQRYTNPAIKRLAALVQRMGAMLGDRFALSYHQVAEVLACTSKQAQQRMIGLCSDGLLRNDDRGKPGRPGRGASRWTWLGPALSTATQDRESWQEVR